MHPQLRQDKRACSDLGSGQLLYRSDADTVVVSSMPALEVAVAAAPPGRNILIAPGTYGIATITLKGNGAEGNPIVIRPQQDLGTVTVNEPRWTFSENSSWLVVEKLYFGGSRVILQGEHNRISRCRFRNINVSASIVTHAARDCRIDHCDFADLNPFKGEPAQPIDIKPRYFTEGTAARLLIDYCYFHNMNPSFGRNGMEVARTYAHKPALELERGQTVTLDHCLFENINIPKEGEILTVKMGGWITRFCILLPVWKRLELSESGVAVWTVEDSHEATQMEAGAEGSDRARGPQGPADRRAVRRA